MSQNASSPHWDGAPVEGLPREEAERCLLQAATLGYRGTRIDDLTLRVAGRWGDLQAATLGDEDSTRS